MNKQLLKEMIDCVKREVGMRFKVYPKLISIGKMTPEEAEREKKLMYLVQISLQKIYDGKAPEEVQAALFDVKEYQEDMTMKNFLNHP